MLANQALNLTASILQCQLDFLKSILNLLLYLSDKTANPNAMICSIISLPFGCLHPVTIQSSSAVLSEDY